MRVWRPHRSRARRGAGAGRRGDTREAAPPEAYRAMLADTTAWAVTTSARRPRTWRSTASISSAVGGHADLWEKAVRNRAAGMMPPPGVRRPEPAAARALPRGSSSRWNRAAAARSKSRPCGRPSPEPRRVRGRHRGFARPCTSSPGRAPAEGRRSRWLRRPGQRPGGLAVVSSTNTSTPRASSPTARWAHPAARPSSLTFRPARGTDQAVRVDGLPLGTRGGLLVEHRFPGNRRLQAQRQRPRDCRLSARHGI